MPKHIEDIVVPERKRSIRDIPIPEGRHRNERQVMSSVLRENHSFDYSSRNNFNLPSRENNSPGGSGKFRWIAIGIAFFILVFAVLAIFNSATLAYLPKSETVSFDGDLYAARKAGEGGLLFSVIKLSRKKSLDVSASKEGGVERKASGIIVIYNANSVEQKLRATTRFETPDGKIYQVPDAITIPGKKVVGGEEKLGTLEIVVYAEHPGKEFNIGLTDFTLPGLKGTSLFSSIYARSKTNMSGGSTGAERLVKNEDETRVKNQLETMLKEELIAEAKAQVPEDFILLTSLSLVTFKDLPQTDSVNENNVTLNMQADLSGIMFKRSDLSTRLALDKVSLATGELVDIIELDLLTYALINNAQAISPLSDEIKFSVTGEATVVWRVDEVALKSDLIARHKRDIPSILNNYPTIVKATTTIRPFWKSSLPEDGADIFLKKLPVK